MAVAARTDPYLDHRFLVEVDSLVVAGFSEVSGLEVELQFEEYQEGGVNEFTHKLPSRFQYPNLVLRRGVTDSRTLWGWLDDSRYAPVARKNGRILLLDSLGTERWGWEFHEAYPVKWTGPDLSADRSSVAIESLELAHRGLTTVDGLPG